MTETPTKPPDERLPGVARSAFTCWLYRQRHEACRQQTRDARWKTLPNTGRATKLVLAATPGAAQEAGCCHLAAVLGHKRGQVR